MALLADITAGTISVDADGTEVTGVGTSWQEAGFREGDWLIANGWVNVVASVESNTALTLAQPWRGGALTDAPYRLRYMSDGSRASAQARQLIDMLGGSGSLEALAALVGVPNTIPYFTGAGTMGLLTRQELTHGVNFDVQVDELSDRDDYDDRDEGFAVLVADVGDGRSALFSRVGDEGNWSDPAYITGPVGPVGPEWLDWKGAWSAGTHDEGSGVEHNGSTYRANKETSEEPPHDDWDLVSKKGDIGPEWIDWRGDWSAGEYTAGQGVTHDGSGYRANTTTTEAPPHTDWDLIVSKGGKGEPGFKPVQVDELSDRDAYDDEDEGFSILVSDVGDGRAAIYSKNSNASADWSDPAYVTGEQGSSGSSAAEDVSYDNAASGLPDNVQGAIDEVASRIQSEWRFMPIGVPIPVFTNIFSSLEAALPPTDNPDYRYVLLTAGEDGVGEYNEGVLTSESVSGSAPLTVATAVIDLDGSPLDGQTINLINTERRSLRAGSSGSAESDALQNITGTLGGAIAGFNYAGNSGALYFQSTTSSLRTQLEAASGTILSFNASRVARTSTETRAKNIGATYIMRIK